MEHVSGIEGSTPMNVEAVDDIESGGSRDDVPFVPYDSSHRYSRTVGKHKPDCAGMCMVPELDCGTNLMWVSWSLIFFPTVIWAAGVAPGYWDDAGPALVLVILATFTGSNTFLFVARYTEPGLLPTRPKPNPDHAGLSAAALRRVKKEHQVVIRNTAYPLPEFRAKFCSQTGNCVENFDHYCPWVGNSVGVRNYRYFVGFVNVTSLHSILVCISSIHLLTLQSGATFSDKVEQKPLALLMALYTAMITLCVGGLASYHWSIIAAGSTTNEELKDVWARQPNPYDKGCWKNVEATLCVPVRASYMREGGEDELAGSILADDWEEAQFQASMENNAARGA